ncbi:MAG: molybdenum cofactor guanylyltransferase [Proteobacteria bacterium]|nr:molybdenum cofactor guanylyltransferase [Pseudomonadota bacterium]MBK7114652.1 molybdenum cofactor guanylyltransferase [Pseudomonadota bacterium]MCC6632374.1 molybdenum cofactor guanylyltransferase [Gammaproteobacteria bacterium]
MPAKEALLGVVIAGGRSLRFGGEKAVASFAGRPLLLWAVERLSRACVEVAVNARPGTEAEALARASGLTVLGDAPGDPDGPLSGVKAGLAWARQRGAASLAVSPCDAPLVPDDLYPRLYAAAGTGAAMVETSEGRQPLFAIWPVAALPQVEAGLEGGAHPPTWRMLEEVGAIRVRFDPPDCFANLNTRQDLERFEQLRLASYQR